MQHLSILLMTLLLLTACESQETAVDKTAQVTKTQQIITEKEKKEAQLLQILQTKELALQKTKEALLHAQKTIETQKKQLQKHSIQAGITVENNTITIDTNKTKAFFENFNQHIETKLKNLTKELREELLNKEKTGINIDTKQINIDLNQTEAFLNDWSQKIEGFVKEFDTIVDKIK